jgi:uncharacterized RDD family membrane protein YckC
MQAFTAPAAAWQFDEELTRGVLWRRIASWFLDLAILAVLAFAVWLVLVVFGILTLGLGFHLMALLPLLPFVYYVGFLAGPNSATPGEAAFGLMVVRNNDLGRPELAQVVVFTLLFYLTIAVGFVLLVVTLLTTRKRALHDLGSGLVVVRRRALTEIAPPWNMPGVA